MSFELVHRLTALANRRPHDKRSLHAYIRAVTGFHVPTVAVCPDHQAPFDFVTDAFFKNFNSFLVLASRGGGKTQNLAILNYLVSRFWPQTGTAHYGAIEAQSSWGFEYLQDILKKGYARGGLVKERSGYVRWANGSSVRVATGRSMTGVTAIRPQRLVMDEVDLWELENFETAQLMVSTQPGQQPQRIAASTAYNAYGLMNVLVSQRLARNFRFYKWCLWETIARCESCKREKCPFYVWVNPRTGKKEALCKGRALRSDGFIPWQTAVDEFYAADSETFAVQKLLYGAERRNLIYPTWSVERHCAPAPIKKLKRHASIGIGVDWGFDHPLVFVVVGQLPNGRYWAFKEYAERFATPDREVEIAKELNEELKRRVGVRKNGEPVYEYPVFYPGKDQPGSIAAFVEAGLTVIPNVVRLRDDGHRHVRRLLDLNKGPLLRIDLQRCPMFAAQMGQIHRDERGREVLKNNDYADAGRHVLASAQELGGIITTGHLMR